jgi:hypothetical protein
MEHSKKNRTAPIRIIWDGVFLGGMPRLLGSGEGVVVLAAVVSSGVAVQRTVPRQWIGMNRCRRGVR